MKFINRQLTLTDCGYTAIYNWMAELCVDCFKSYSNFYKLVNFKQRNKGISISELVNILENLGFSYRLYGICKLKGQMKSTKDIKNTLKNIKGKTGILQYCRLDGTGHYVFVRNVGTEKQRIYNDYNEITDKFLKTIKRVGFIELIK